jgi:hypothetical protein
MLSAVPESRGIPPGSTRPAGARDAPRPLERAPTYRARRVLRKPPRAQRSRRSAVWTSAGVEQRWRAIDAGRSGQTSEGGIAGQARRDAGWTSRLHGAPVPMRGGILGSQPARPSRPSVDISGPLESSTRRHRDAANCRSFAAAAAKLFAADHRPPARLPNAHH